MRSVPSPNADRRSESDSDIAVVGLGIRLPGGIRDLGALWDLLAGGGDTVRPVPGDRWDERFFDDDPTRAGTTYCRVGSFLDDVDRFDADFFGISPREARAMDPQQRLLLEVAWEAMEDAGHPREWWAGSRTGVYVGLLAPDYTVLHAKTSGVDGIDPYYATGKEFSFAAGRLNYLFDLTGPALTVTTACSSSLVATHLACVSLRGHESDVALAAGVNLMLTPELSVFMSKVQAMSPTGSCKPFDAGADGVVRGEGCVVAVLKRLADARADGNRIYAVLRGSAVNHDGHSAGLTVPNAGAQQKVIRQAIEAAGVDPADVAYVEAHGTGTPLGDPIEISALADTYGVARADRSPLVVGSHKANFGHLDSAAGITGLLKAILVARHRAVPPQPRLGTLNPMVDWDRTHITLPTELTPLPDDAGDLVAVSAFGLSGTNAHVILEAAPADVAEGGGSDEAERSHVVALSAHDEDLLPALANQLAGASASLADLAYTTTARRTAHAHRAAVVATDADELRTALDALAAGEDSPDVVIGSVEDRDPPRVVFAFSGQGSQWAGMATRLYECEPIVRATLDEIDELIRRDASWSLLETLRATDDRLRATELAQPAIFAVQLAVARLWESWGVRPAAVVGHSMGEIAAACFAGGLDLAAATRLIVARGRLMRAATGTGRMAAVTATQDEIRPLLDAVGSDVCVATVNGPRSLVVAGTAAGVTAVAKACDDAGLRCVPLPVDYAFHSPLVRRYGDELEELLADLRPSQPRIRLLSSVTPDREPTLDARYWGDNVREPVLLWPAVDAYLAATPDTADVAFVEIGAHPVLTRPLADALATREHPGFAVPSLQRGVPGHRSIARSLARLHVAGVAVDWATRAPGHQVALPPYPWGGDRYWLTGVERGEQGGPASAPRKLRAVVSVYDEKDRLVATVDDARLRPAEAEAPTPAAAASSAVGVAAAPAAERSAPRRPSAQPAPAPATGGPAAGRRSGATAVRAAVEAAVSEVLGREGRRSLPNRRSLFELGLDSLSAVEAGRRVGERFGMDLPRTVVFDHPTLEALTAYLVDNGAAVDTAPAADETAAADEAPSTASAPVADESLANEPIAVVGLACRFPGAPDADAYWDLLASGRNAIRDIPRERFDADALLGAGEPGTIATTRGGFLDDVSGFDAGFFRVSPREARAMDPQQRLLMEVAWEAIEDAGLPQDALRDTPTGVYVGLNTADYQQLLTRVDENVDLYYGTGNCFSGAAGRLSYFLGLRGPSIAVDTACSSALTATHLACQALRAGECDVAIAGGANTIVAPTVYLAMSAGGALAPDGQCKTFDEAADGYARGEGAGVLVLKPLSKALADGDRVHAVIRGSAVNQDGASGGLTVPSGPAQVDVIRAALRNAGTTAAEVDYVEAHGTGTALGDPIEIQSLAAALGEGRDDAPVLVGSVKTNVGHLEAAAGVASLVKVVLSLRNELLPAHLNLTKPSSRIDWDRLPVRVVTEPTPWPRSERPRIAGVSGFGFTGTNAHVILAEAPQQERVAVDADALDRGLAVPLSAASEPALRALAGAVAERVAAAGDDPATLAGIARTAALHRTHLEHRAVASGTSADDLAAALRAVAAGHRHPGAVTGRAPGAERRGLALVVGDPATVLGGDWIRLAQQDPAFSAAVDEWDALVRARLGWSVRDALGGPRGGDRAHVLALAAQVALGRALAARGALPDVVVGTPGGHVAAAVLAGAITAEAALTELTSGTVATRRASDVELVEHAVPVFEACASPESVAELLGATLPVGGDVALVLGAGLPVGEPVPVETDAGDGVLLTLAGAAKDGVAGLLRDVAALHAHGCAVDWAATLPEATPVELPHYPWQRSAYWFERVAPSATGDRAASSACDVASGAAAAGALLDAAATELGASRLVLRELRVAAAGAANASCDTATGEVRLLAGSREVAGAVARVAEPRPAELDGDAVELPAAGTPAEALAAMVGALDGADLSGARELYADLDVTPTRAFVSRAGDGAPADVVAVDGDGRVALAVTGAVVVAAGRPLADDVRERVAERAYRWDWVEIARPDTAAAETVAVCGGADLAGNVAEALSTAGVGDVRRVDLAETDAATLAGQLPDGAVVAYAATGGSVERAAADLLAIATALAEAGRGRRLWIVTAGAEAARGRRPEPGAAALAALGRVLAAEYPETWGGLVDDDPLAERPGTAAAAALVAAPADGDAREDRVCVRGGRWYAARLVAAADAVPAATAAPAIAADAWCVVTGGADTSGAPYARWLVDRGARRLLVTGSGAGVADVGNDVETRVVADDPDAVRAALADLDARIAAVLHAPADPPVTAIDETPADALAADLRRARLADVLDDATRDDPPTLFVLTCSAAPLWGSLGTANRALAAGWTAAVAERRAGAGLPAQVVETMPRDDTGELAERDRTMMAGAGLEPLTADDVVEALDALASGAGRVTLAKVARDVFARRSAERLPRAELALLAGGSAAAGASSGGDTPLVAELRAALPDDRLDLLVERVCAATAEALGRAPGDEVDPGQGFFELGMDSVMSLALKTRLENETGLSLPNTLTFESPNSRALARYLLTEELAGVLDAEPATETTEATEATEPAERAAARTAEPADEDDDDLLARLDDALSTSSMLLNEEGAA